VRKTRLFLLALGIGLLLAGPAAAQSISIDLGKDAGSAGGLTERIVELVALITVLSLAPSILVMVTSFARITIVLSLLRTALGLQQSPPNSVLISLALFLTAFIMAPTFKTAYQDGISPYLDQSASFEEAIPKVTKPFQTFMLAHVREPDLALFIDMAGDPKPKTAVDTPLTTLIPAFLISELRRSFEIGFLLFVPFLVIDMVVSSILMSMGMMMLPPVIISLPFKLIFFVLCDGWHLVAGSLVKSFAPH
jgi:flagellar biosynthetic protein FliP